MDFDFLASLHPLLAILVWDVMAGGIDANTRTLAELVDEQGIDDSELAGILAGANLDSLNTIEALCKDEIDDLRRIFFERDGHMDNE